MTGQSVAFQGLAGGTSTVPPHWDRARTKHGTVPRISSRAASPYIIDNSTRLTYVLRSNRPSPSSVLLYAVQGSSDCCDGRRGCQFARIEEDINTVHTTHARCSHKSDHVYYSAREVRYMRKISYTQCAADSQRGIEPGRCDRDFTRLGGCVHYGGLTAFCGLIFRNSHKCIHLFFGIFILIPPTRGTRRISSGVYVIYNETSSYDVL